MTGKTSLSLLFLGCVLVLAGCGRKSDLAAPTPTATQPAPITVNEDQINSNNGLVPDLSKPLSGKPVNSNSLNNNN